MFKLIALALHFSSCSQGAIDPIVVEMLKNEIDRDAQKKEPGTENIVALETAALETAALETTALATKQPSPETRKAA